MRPTNHGRVLHRPPGIARQADAVAEAALPGQRRRRIPCICRRIPEGPQVPKPEAPASEAACPGGATPEQRAGKAELEKLVGDANRVLTLLGERAVQPHEIQPVGPATYSRLIASDRLRGKIPVPEQLLRVAVCAKGECPIRDAMIPKAAGLFYKPSGGGAVAVAAKAKESAATELAAEIAQLEAGVEGALQDEDHDLCDELSLELQDLRDLQAAEEAEGADEDHYSGDRVLERLEHEMRHVAKDRHLPIDEKAAQGAALRKEIERRKETLDRAAGVIRAEEDEELDLGPVRVPWDEVPELQLSGKLMDEGLVWAAALHSEDWMYWLDAKPLLVEAGAPRTFFAARSPPPQSSSRPGVPAC